MNRFALVLTVLASMSSAETVTARAFSHGVWGQHHSCDVYVNEAGDALIASTSGVISALTLEEVDLTLDQLPNLPAGFREGSPEQTYAGQWLQQRGFPTLHELQMNPFACALLS